MLVGEISDVLPISASFTWKERERERGQRGRRKEGFMSRLFYCTCLLLVVDKWTGDDIGHGLLRLVLVLVQVPVGQVQVVHHSCCVCQFQMYTDLYVGLDELS